MSAGTKVRWIALAGMGLALGCAKADAPKSDAALAPAGPNVVEVGATEFAFTMPDSIPAGPTTFRLTNSGAQIHHLQLVRLEDGKTLADMQGMDPNGPPPSWVVEVGGPNAAAPGGGVSEGTLDLAPGNYAALCFVPGPDGMPHVMKGMMHPLTVVPSSEVRAMPEADVTLTLADYSFSPSAPLTSGKHVIKLVNAAQQTHELVLVKLGPGKTPQDLLQWVEKQDGPPPGTPIGGATGIGPGGTQLMSVDLTPGEYGLFCFVPDATDGKPHFMHGMVQQITIN